MNEMYDLSDLSLDPHKSIIDEFRTSVGELMGSINSEPMMPPPQAGMNNLASLAGGGPPQGSPQNPALAQTQPPPVDPTMIPPQTIGQQMPNQMPQGGRPEDPMSQTSPNPNLM